MEKNFFKCVCVYIYVYMYIYVCVCIYIYIYASKSLQPCPTRCDPIDGSSPCSPIPGILQGQRSLVGCRLWGCTESDTTEVT